MTQEIIQSYARRSARGWLWGLLIAIVLIGSFLCLAAGIALLPASVIDPDTKIYLFIGLFILFFFVFLAGIIAALLFYRKRIFSGFDAAFASFGLVPSSYLLSGRQYRGVSRGRKVNVYYHVSGGRNLSTPDLSIYVSGNFRTRLGIGEKNALTLAGGSLMKKQPLETGDPDYREMLIYPLDETWACSLLGDSQVRRAVVRLVGREAPGIRALVYGPEALRLQIRHFDISVVTPEAVRQWLEDMLLLAEVAESLMPPSETDVASDLERASQSDRKKFTPIALTIVAVLIGCPLLLLGVVILAMALLGVFS
jgi:hypothetical protein